MLKDVECQHLCTSTLTAYESNFLASTMDRASYQVHLELDGFPLNPYYRHSYADGTFHTFHEGSLNVGTMGGIMDEGWANKSRGHRSDREWMRNHLPLRLNNHYE